MEKELIKKGSDLVFTTIYIYMVGFIGVTHSICESGRGTSLIIIHVKSIDL